MGFADEVLRLAYEKTVYKKQKMDWDYMNGILCGWHRKNLHTLAEVEAGDRQRRPAAQPAMQGRPAAPGEADQRVREDLERMREFLRRQQEPQLIELADESKYPCSERALAKAASVKMRLTPFCASSKLPFAANTITLSPACVVIWRRWMLLVPPSG